MTDSSDHEAFLDMLQEIIDLQMAGDLTTAIEQISKILPKHAESPELLLLTAVCSYRQSKTGQAIELCEKAHEIDPECQEVVDALAVLKTVTGNINDGLYYAKLATTLSPHQEIPDLLPPDFSSFFHALSIAAPSRHFLDGHYMFNGRRFEDAVSEFEAELSVNADNLEARKMLGHARLFTGMPKEALQDFSVYAATYPDNAEVYALSARAKSMMADFEGAAALCREAIEKAPDSVENLMQVLETARYFEGDLADIYTDTVRLLNEVTAKAADEIAPRTRSVARAEDKPITVGILSNDLRDGDQYGFLMPIIEEMDPKAYSLTVYQQSPTGDPVFQEFRSKSPNWRRIVDMDDEVLALILSRQKTDILLDLCGFSSNARPVVFAANPAPVISNILCEPYGFGAPGTNVIIADKATLESDRAQLQSDQQIVECESGLFAIKPPVLMGRVQPLPALSNGHVTYGTQCIPQAFSPSSIEFWSRVLSTVDDARLLFGNVANVPQYMRARVRELFDAHGISDRIDFMDTLVQDGNRAHFFNNIDVYLDSVPVNGTRALCHALWMGVPVVTVKGTARRGLVGASILTSAGKAGWIANDLNQAVSIACELVSDKDSLSATRNTLRDEMKDSALMDTAGYARSMMAALKQALEKTDA